MLDTYVHVYTVLLTPLILKQHFVLCVLQVCISINIKKRMNHLSLYVETSYLYICPEVQEKMKLYI